MESERSPTCARCAYWATVRPNEGSCRRHGPCGGTAADPIAHWPHSHGDQWCGEFVAAGGAQLLTGCAECRFWRHTEDGLQPVDRGDRVAAWWGLAGLCCRCAPVPTEDPGPRVYWPATHITDRCGDGDRIARRTTMD